MRGENKSGDEPKKTYQYYYCRRCKNYFTLSSHISGSDCPFCSAPWPGRAFSMGVLATDTLIRDRIHIAIAKCAKCLEVHRCPECFGSEKKNPDNCRICPCAGCCGETVEFANGIKSGEISLWQVIEDLAKKRGAKPGPMAKMMKEEFGDEIPF
jgi:hypothetical protein